MGFTKNEQNNESNIGAVPRLSSRSALSLMAQNMIEALVGGAIINQRKSWWTEAVNIFFKLKIEKKQV